jgi:hypothetical protein
MADVFLGLALIFVGIFVVLSIVIVHEVNRRGVKISVLWLRLYLIKYIHQYRKLTLEEKGRVGPLYRPCLISVNLALVFAVLGMLLK